MFDGDKLPHELLVTTRQKTKVGNAFEKICQLILNCLKRKYLK